MQYAVLLRDLRLSVPVFDKNFEKDHFSNIFVTLRNFEHRMQNFEHHMDKIEYAMGKLEHRIDKMERRMVKLQTELDSVEVNAINSIRSMKDVFRTPNADQAALPGDALTLGFPLGSNIDR